MPLKRLLQTIILLRTMIPDLILCNGTIHTQDDSLPFASAVAVSGNKILAVGNDADMLSCVSNETSIIDLEKKLVLPGFIDSHFHFYDFALNYDSIDFFACRR